MRVSACRKAVLGQRVTPCVNFSLRVFGSRNERLVRARTRRARANELEPQIKELSDEALCERTEEFRKRVKEGATLDELLPEAFAVVRRGGPAHAENARTSMCAADRRHHAAQGDDSEMPHGEGKRWWRRLPAYLNALSGEGVHIVTVNEYLAQRDADWMGRGVSLLGLSLE